MKKTVDRTQVRVIRKFAAKRSIADMLRGLLRAHCNT